MNNPHVNPGLIEKLKTIDSPTISNAIETLKLWPRAEGFTPLQLRCLSPELGRMCGYAVTAHVETVTQMHPTEERIFLELFNAVGNSPKPVVVAFQEIGGYGDYAAHCGEVMATIFTRLGAVGLVSDCGVRDVPEVRALGFHYFARGCVVSHASFRIADRTMIWFCSDNGPEGKTGLEKNSRGSTGGLRRRKRSLFEGGIRVPSLLVWPGQAPAGRLVDVPSSTLDYFPKKPCKSWRR